MAYFINNNKGISNDIVYFRFLYPMSTTNPVHPLFDLNAFLTYLPTPKIPVLRKKVCTPGCFHLA